MGKFVTVPLEKLKSLLSKASSLDQLEEQGVDNWNGYEECEDLWPKISNEEIENEFTIFEE